MSKKLCDSCFVCGKKSAIGYDFIVVEQANTAMKEQVLVQERICGIARLTLCINCLQFGIDAMVADSIKKDGTPKLFLKKVVESFLSLRYKLDSGLFEDTPEMEEHFIVSFNLKPVVPMISNYITLGNRGFTIRYVHDENKSPAMEKLFKKKYLGSLPFSEIPKQLHTPLMERLINKVIEPPYVLWVQGYKPFQCRIEPTIKNYFGTEESNMILFPIKQCLTNPPTFFMKETRDSIREIISYYVNELSAM